LLGFSVLKIDLSYFYGKLSQKYIIFWDSNPEILKIHA